MIMKYIVYINKYLYLSVRRAIIYENTYIQIYSYFCEVDRRREKEEIERDRESKARAQNQEENILSQ